MGIVSTGRGSGSAILFVLAAPFAVSGPACAVDAVGEIAAFAGSGTIDRGGQSIPFAIGTSVIADDLLATGPDGKVHVRFADDTELTLGPNADILIDEFVFADSDDDGAVFNLIGGPARFVTGKLERARGKGIDVNTPVAAIGIRGTDFFTELSGDKLAVALFSGYKVDVTNPSGTTTLRPGEGTDAFGAAQPTPALSWQPDRINRALDLVTVLPNNRRPLPYLKAVANADNFAEALTDGAVFGNLRLRYEHVDEHAFVRSAHATTARARLGYETAALNGFYAGAEFEGTADLGDRRNDGVNGRVTLPAIADPNAEVVNQAYVGWTGAGADGLARDRVVVGRQTLNFENERWLGSVGFRQNDQSFDAATLETRVIDGVSLRYAYLDRVNRILGNNPGGHWQSDSHAFAVTTNLIPRSYVTAFAYLLDLKPVPQFSSNTVGVRYDGAWPVAPGTSFLLEAEYANQKDAAANPANYSLSYWLVRPAVKWGGWTFYAGIERLGGNGTSAVQTPLATLHRHNGWADVFLTTPANGLRDTHARVTYSMPDGGIFKTPKLDLRVHDFQPTGSGRRYGREFDADVNASVLGWVTVGARYARYDAAAFKSDTEKIWFYAEFPL